jgi:hypothetical protein
MTTRSNNNQALPFMPAFATMMDVDNTPGVSPTSLNMIGWCANEM